MHLTNAYITVAQKNFKLQIPTPRRSLKVNREHTLMPAVRDMKLPFTMLNPNKGSIKDEVM